MIKKLLKKCNFKTSSEFRRASLLTPLFIIILYLGGVTNVKASNFDGNSDIANANNVLEDLTNFPKLIKSYNITDASTEDKSCFPTKGKGVIFQRADDCKGLHHIWRVKDELTFNEYDNGTATIVGTVIDDQGEIGLVNIALYDKESQGTTWNASCYVDEISDPRSLYQSFNGTIKVGSNSYSVEKKQSEKHFILADGAGFEPGQYGFGAWTSGSFGGCTEWFGNLDPIDTDCDLTVDAGEDQSNCNLEEIVLTANASNASDCSTITSKYKIINSNTEVGCFTADPGMIFQKGGSCKGIDYIWRAGDDLFLNEYDNDTAKITGTVIDQNGRIGIVDISLTDKENTGTTWNASCYLDGISGEETYYRSFYGTITADGIPVTVGTRFNAHYILAQGAGFDSNQYGLGAWTGGAFGECTEWFGNLVPQTIEGNSNGVDYVWSTTDGNIISDSNQQTITVNQPGTYKVTAKDCLDCEAFDTVVVTELPGPTVEAGDDVEVCVEELVELTASADDISACPGGCVYPIEQIARCNNASNLSDVWLNNITNSNKGFVTSSSEFKTYDNGIATYTAIASNGIDNIEVDITFSGYTTMAPELSPKESNCGTYDTTDWVYWTNTSGTIVTEQHGTLIVSRAGPSMQMGNGADVTRDGFGASGWLTISGGDGFYTAGDVNIKLGNCDAFDAVTAVDYNWSTTDGNIVGDANQKTITVDKSGTYTVSVSDCESCSASDSVNVTIAEPKAHIIQGGANFCIDGEADYLTDNVIQILGATQGANNTFVVTDSNGKILALPATFAAVKQIDFDGAGLGTCLLWNLAYEDGLQGAAIGSNANDLEGCFDLSAAVKIIRSAAPVVNAGDDVVICKGDEVILNVTGEGSILWSTGETTSSIKVDPTVDTSYTVTVTSDLGCSATDEVKVSLNPEVTANAGADVSICEDEEVELTATGGGTYLWSTGETTASIMVLPTADTTYTVTVTSAEGCEDSDEVLVTVNAEVIANAGADVVICSGEELELTATGGGSYLWSSGETTASIMVSPTVDTTYNVTVTSNEGCEASDDVKVSLNPEVTANAGADVSICSGGEVELTATGGGSYLWSTGETTASIMVSPTADTKYTITVTSNEGCKATDDVMVSVADKVIIGDFVWLDENQNGLQDDGATGINNVKVTLYECNGAEVASTMTADNDAGEAGAYSFEVCPDSGYYYVIFDDVPELLEFTSINDGDDALDSDANENGRTQCFNVENEDILTIDAGLIEKCDIKVNAGDDGEICEDEIIELTADILDDTADCPGGCVYPIKTQDRCYGPTGDFEVYLVSTGSVENFKFTASEQKFERLADNSVRYTATASNGKDVIEVNALLTGYTQIAPINSPKTNECQQYDTSDWEYWTTWSGTISSRDHGVFNLSVKGAAFQMGVGADVVRTGFGASGWFYVDGGDGFYTEGDINVTLEECVEDGIMYQWSTEDGNIVGSSNQKTIQVDEPGTYTVEVVNCIDCYTTDSIKLVKGVCFLNSKFNSPKMSTVYPVPVKSGGTLTIEFDITDTSNGDELKAVSLKAGVDYIERKEDVSVVLYNVLGQMISAPKMYKMENGKATIYLDLDYIPTGKYIVRAQGPTWSDAKNIVVE